MALLELIKEGTVLLVGGDEDSGNVGGDVTLELTDADSIRIPTTEF